MKFANNSGALGRIDFHIRLVVVLVSLIGYAVLFLAGVYPLIYIPVVVLSMLAGYRYFYSEKLPFVPESIWTIATLIIVIGPVVLSFMGRLFFLDALDFIFLLLPLIKLLTTRSERDYLQIFALSFGQVLYGTIVNLDLSFGIALVAYLAATIWGLILISFKMAAMKSEHQQYQLEEAEKAIFRKQYLAFVMILPLVALIITSGLFFIIPRPGSALASFAFGVGKRQSGFSDQVSIGDVGEIKLDHSVAMRVAVSGRELQHPIYWRGAVLDTFDGIQWTMDKTIPPYVAKERQSSLFQLTTQKKHKLSKQRFFMDGTSTSYIFHADFIGWVKARSHQLKIHANGSVVLPEKRSHLQYYEAWSSTYSTFTIPEPAWETFLQLPNNLDKRVVQLTRQVSKDAKTPMEAALKIKNYLQTTFDYSLQAGLRPVADPLAYFLFDLKAGHCEYFATSMVIMLRTLGIHSRMVTGYQQGEYIESEDYYLVRQSDAHTWVEAWIGEHWVRFDPTPAAGLASYDKGLMNDIKSFIDSLSFKWQRYVIAYSVIDQIEMMLKADAKIQTTNFYDVKMWFKKHLLDFAAVLLVIAFAVLYVKRKSILQWLVALLSQKSRSEQLSRHFEKIRKILIKAGLKIDDSMTARETIELATLKFDSIKDPLGSWLKIFEPLRYDPDSDVQINSEKLSELEHKIKNGLKNNP